MSSFFNGDPGTTASLADSTATNNAQNALQKYTSASSNPQVQQILAQYGNGGMNLQQAQSALSGLGGDTAQGGLSQLYSSPGTASNVAQSQVQNNPLYGNTFAQGGTEQQAQGNYTNATNNLNSIQNTLNGADRNALSGNDSSYGLQNSDLAAYGQAADAIGRSSAAQSQGIAQSLAARGLGSSSNGAAIGSYAGNYGNQAEQLAGLQQQISQNRINTAQGLAQARNSSDLQQMQGDISQQQNAGNLSQGLASLGNQAYEGQLGANNNMANNEYNQLQGSANSALQNQIGQQNVNNSQYSQYNGSKTQGLFGAIGSGIKSGAANIGSQATQAGGQAALGTLIG